MQNECHDTSPIVSYGNLLLAVACWLVFKRRMSPWNLAGNDVCRSSILFPDCMVFRTLSLRMSGLDDQCSDDVCKAPRTKCKISENLHTGPS
jgi:hypothetical protein